MNAVAATLDPRGRTSWTLVLSVGLTLLLGLGCAAAASGYLVTVISVLVCLVAAIPILVNREPYDLFAPWNYMFYFLILYVLVRSVFIDFDITGGRIDLDAIYYLSKPPEFMVRATALMLFGFVFLVIGFMIPVNRPIRLDWRIFQGRPLHSRRLKRMLFFTLFIALCAFTAFVAATFKGAGDFALQMLSSHRGLTTDLDEYQSYGYLRLLVGLSNLAAYAAYAQSRVDKSQRMRRFYRRIVALGLFISLLMAFYSQSRAALIFAVLNILFIKYYLDGRRFPVKMFAVIAPIGIALFTVTSMLRGGTGVTLTDRITPMTVVAPIVLTTSGIDASKTAHIVDYVDDTQDFKFGTTLVQFATAVVPRQLWQGKPVNLDTFIGEKIYGATVYGSSAVPAGFFGEMYLNFWYAGIVGGSLLLGMFLKFLTNLLAGNRESLGFVLVYVVMLQQLGMSFLASGVSSTIIGALSAGIPMIIALFYLTPRVARRS